MSQNTVTIKGKDIVDSINRYRNSTCKSYLKYLPGTSRYILQVPSGITIETKYINKRILKEDDVEYISYTAKDEK